MKKERIRKNKETMKILRSNGFRDPMQLYVDSTFLTAVDKMENGRRVVMRYFDTYPKFYVSKCEFEKYRKECKNNTLGELSGHCQIRKCDCTDNEPCCLSEQKIINDTNKKHYILATNTRSYMQMYRKMNVPTFTIIKSIPTLNIGKMKQMKFDRNGKEATSKELKKLRQTIGE